MNNRQKFIKVIEEKQTEITSTKIISLFHAISEQNKVETVAINQNKTIQLYNDGKIKWQLNSSVDPEKASDIWTKQFETLETNEHFIFLIFGMGDGEVVKKLLQLHSECRFLIYEPSLELFYEASERDAWLDIIKNKRVRLYVKGLNDERFFHHLQELIDYTNIYLMHLGVLPNYDRIFISEYQKFREIIDDAMKLVLYTKNTELERACEIANNMYSLSDDIIHQYSVQQLFGSANKMGWTNMPAILVAAGPSLDQNLKWLEKFQKKAFMISVDTALNTLLENDIIPDLTISVDSRKPMELFEHPKFQDIPIVLSQQSNSAILEKNDAVHFYEIDEESYLNKMFIQKTGKSGIQLPTGGSVANNALSLLVLMGFQMIILVGQDLAYPNMQEYTKSAYKGEKKCIQPEKDEYILVRDVNGGMVYTKENMNIYRKWMEHYIEGHPQVRVINTSDQGAYIAETEKMMLEECYFIFEKKEIDVQKLWEQIPLFFNQNELSDIHDTLCEIPQKIEEIQKIVQEGLECCHKAEHAYLAKQYEKINDNLKQLAMIVERAEQYPEMILLRPYTIKAQYEVQETVYQFSDKDDKDTVDKEIKESVFSAKLLMEAYQMGINQFREEMFRLVPQI